MFCPICRAALEPPTIDKVVALLLNDATVAAIGRAVGRSKRTGSRYVGAVLRHYGARNRIELGYLIGHADGTEGRPPRIANRSAKPY